METEDFLSLTYSSGIAVRQCLNVGLGQFFVDEMSDVRSFVCLRLLSAGIERYAKIILQVFRYQEEGEFYDVDQLKSWGHQVELIASHVVEGSHGVPRSVGKEAIELRRTIEADDLLWDFLELLEEFAANWSRYDFLNVTAGEDSFGGNYSQLFADVLDPHWNEGESWTDFRVRPVASIERLVTYFTWTVRKSDLPDIHKNVVWDIEQKFGDLDRQGFGKRTYPQDWQNLG